MQLSHVAPVRRAVFDDPSLVSSAGLVPVLGLAHRAGLGELAGEHLTVAGGAGSAAGLKVSALVAGMVAGADSIDDMDLLRHGAMGQLFVGVRAPSTLGTFLRAFRFGHVRQLDAVAARFLAGLAEHTALIKAGAPVTYLDIDDTVRATFGYAKQGAGYGYTGVKGLNALLATVSTACSAPVIVATRLRRGRRTPRAAPPGWSPTRSRPPAAAGAGRWCCAPTRPITTGTWSPQPGDTESTSASLPARTGPSPQRSRRSVRTRGRPSATRKPSSTSNCSSGSAPPRAPRCP